MSSHNSKHTDEIPMLFLLFLTRFHVGQCECAPSNFFRNVCDCCQIFCTMCMHGAQHSNPDLFPTNNSLSYVTPSLDCLNIQIVPIRAEMVVRK